MPAIALKFGQPRSLHILPLPIAADSIEISIIGMLCDEIEGYNQRVALIKKAASFPEFKLISVYQERDS